MSELLIFFAGIMVGAFFTLIAIAVVQSGRDEE
jgi:hypothetical protein